MFSIQFILIWIGKQSLTFSPESQEMLRSLEHHILFYMLASWETDTLFTHNL